MAQDIYYCKNCGGVMVFDVKSQTLKCPNCDTEEKIQNYKETIKEHTFNRNAIHKLSVTEKTSQTKQCVNCGAMIEIEQDCTAKKCPYCGSDYVLAGKQAEAVVPDGIVPFKIDGNQAGEIFAKWIKGCFFAPSSMKKMYVKDSMAGIYMPYWTFDADVDCEYDAEGGKIRTETVKNKDGTTTTKSHTDWYPTHGFIHHVFDDVQIPGSNNLDVSLMNGIEPYDTIHGLMSYSPKYLSGYAAQIYNVPLLDAHGQAIREMQAMLDNMADEDVRRRYDTCRNVRIRPRYKEETYKYVMIPLYSTAFTYKEKRYTVLINGQTGKIKGEYPKSPVKIAILIAVILAVVAAIYGFWSSREETEDDIGTVAWTQEYDDFQAEI